MSYKCDKKKNGSCSIHSFFNKTTFRVWYLLTLYLLYSSTLFLLLHLTNKMECVIKNTFFMFMTVISVLVFVNGGNRVEAQVHHVVGQDPGWEVATNIASWASGRNFFVGDFLCMLSLYSSLFIQFLLMCENLYSHNIY